MDGQVKSSTICRLTTYRAVVLLLSRERHVNEVHLSHAQRESFWLFNLSLELINMSSVIDCCPDDYDPDSGVLKQGAK